MGIIRMATAYIRPQPDVLVTYRAILHSHGLALGIPSRLHWNSGKVYRNVRVYMQRFSPILLKNIRIWSVYLAGFTSQVRQRADSACNKGGSAYSVRQQGRISHPFA